VNKQIPLTTVLIVVELLHVRPNRTTRVYTLYIIEYLTQLYWALLSHAAAQN